MYFNLQSLVEQADLDILASLEIPFSDSEIEDTIKDLPNDKSPGPDGFNYEFIKSCWSIFQRISSF
jgi:hypothetical protein